MGNELLKAYAEIDEILSCMEEKYVEKIPKRLRELFKTKRLDGYSVVINPKIPLDKQNLQKKTYSILAMLNLNYWCENENERKELLALYAENDRKKEEEAIEKYNPDNIFKTAEPIQVKQEESTALIEYKENNFFKKILNKILSFFRGN